MSIDRRGIGSDFIEKVKQANNLVSVAGRYLQLKQKGKTHWACCPFHHEKTPSFALNELQQYYHCFGCGVSGDVITLVQQLESLDFFGAVEVLAKNAGLEMPAQSMDENYAKTVQKKQRVLKALTEVVSFYCQNIFKEKNSMYHKYLNDRGIDDELIKMFRIGVCGDWTESVKHLKAKGFSEQDLIDAGIALRGKHGLYDVMGERITFSIFNLLGDCIGFSGRTMSTDKEIAKYKNTAQTIVFDKGSIVYGIDVLKKNKLANFVDRLLVVEGNIDVISLVGAGFLNTVACMGTALTAFHAKVFKRFTDKVYICFDGDAAGVKATLRGLDILQAENIDVRVVSVPDGLDPDDYVKKYGKDKFQDLIDNALPLIDFKLEHLAKTNDLKDNLDKTKYLEAAVEVLRSIGDKPELELYIPKVSKVSGVSFDTILRAVNEQGKKVVTGKKPVSKVKGTGDAIAKGDGGYTTAYARALNFVMASLLHDKDYTNRQNDPDTVDITQFTEDVIPIENNLYKRLIEKIAEYKKTGRDWKVSFVFDEFDTAETVQLDNLVNFPFETSHLPDNAKEGLEKYYKDSVKYLVSADLKRQVDELKVQYKQTDNTEQQTQIAMKIQELNKRIKNK